MKKIYLLVYVTGFTSEADVTVFTSFDSAKIKFRSIIESDLISSRELKRTLGINDYDSLIEHDRRQLSRQEIFIDSAFDITFEMGSGDYARLYIQEEEIEMS